MSISDALFDLPLIAVIRAESVNAYRRILPALIDGGVRTLELTMTTPGTLDVFPKLRAEFSSDVRLGVGTIRSVDDALAAIEAGADFVVSPHTDLEIIRAAHRLDVPVFPGALTPTEVNAALQAGATAVKLFPAGATSPSLARQLLGPFPELSFLPSGGIGLEDVAPWLAAGATAVCVGGPLIGTDDTPAAEVTRRARLYVDAATSGRRVT